MWHVRALKTGSSVPHPPGVPGVQAQAEREKSQIPEAEFQRNGRQGCEMAWHDSTLVCYDMRVEFFGACFFCFCRIRFLEASTPCLCLPFVGHRICLAIRDKACIAGWHWTRGKSGPMTLFCLSNSGTHHFREALVEGQTQGFQRKHKQGPHNERAWLRKFATQGTGSLDGRIAVVNMFISQPTLVCPPLQKEKEQFCIGLCLRTTLPKSRGLVGGVEVSIVCLVQHETRHCRSCAFSCRVFGRHVKQQTLNGCLVGCVFVSLGKTPLNFWLRLNIKVWVQPAGLKHVLGS